MITLSLLQYLQDNGLGEIDVNLFWEKLALKRKGIYIRSLGRPQVRGQRTVQMYELYSRGTDDVQGYEQLKAVADFLNDAYLECRLPAVQGYTDTAYDNVTIMPVSTITNAGEDADGLIWSCSGSIIY